VSLLSLRSTGSGEGEAGERENPRRKEGGGGGATRSDFSSSESFRVVRQKKKGIEGKRRETGHRLLFFASQTRFAIVRGGEKRKIRGGRERKRHRSYPGPRRIKEGKGIRWGKGGGGETNLRLRGLLLLKALGRKKEEKESRVAVNRPFDFFEGSERRKEKRALFALTHFFPAGGEEKESCGRERVLTFPLFFLSCRRKESKRRVWLSSYSFPLLWVGTGRKGKQRKQKEGLTTLLTLPSSLS